MKLCLKKSSVIFFSLLTMNSQADTLPISIYNIQPSHYISPHQEGRITLDDLWPGAIYTVTCEILNGSYSEHPVNIKMGDSHLLLTPIFSVNDTPGNQAALTQYNNKYIAKQVSKISGNGHFLSITNIDNNAQIYIKNCTANLAVD